MFTVYTVRGFVFILARPPPQSRPAFTGHGSGHVLPWLVPIRAFAGGAKLRLALPLWRPLVIASLTLPVPHNLLYLRHRRHVT